MNSQVRSVLSSLVTPDANELLNAIPPALSQVTTGVARALCELGAVLPEPVSGRALATHVNLEAS